MADARGYSKTITDAGGVLMTDTCSAFAQAIPPGTKVAALDSAKQAHYLPGDHEHPGLVRFDRRLHQRGGDGTMESGAIVTDILLSRRHEGHEVTQYETKMLRGLRVFVMKG